MNDGDVVEMQGSGKDPYKLKRQGSVYSCSCPAWRNQSQPINLRTCKHLRKLLGDAHEQTRIGGSLVTKAGPTKNKVTAVAPALMLAEKWDESIDPTGYFMSEKLDGVRAYWDGTKFLSRLGNEFYPPAWFTKTFTKDKLDGELWMGRGKFQETVSIVRTHGLDKEWRAISYQIYDYPDTTMKVEDRIRRYLKLVKTINLPHVVAVDQTLCLGFDHLNKVLSNIEEEKGEGLILRVPGSLYEGHRSNNLLKVKSFLDGEAVVIGYEHGKGNRTGMVGALKVEGCGDFKGKKFAIGTGLTHKILKNPPTIGTKITFKYAKGALSEDGLPKPAVYVGEAVDK